MWKAVYLQASGELLRLTRRLDVGGRWWIAGRKLHVRNRNDSPGPAGGGLNGTRDRGTKGNPGGDALRHRVSRVRQVSPADGSRRGTLQDAKANELREVYEREVEGRNVSVSMHQNAPEKLMSGLLDVLRDELEPFIDPGTEGSGIRSRFKEAVPNRSPSRTAACSASTTIPSCGTSRGRWFRRPRSWVCSRRPAHWRLGARDNLWKFGWRRF